MSTSSVSKVKGILILSEAQVRQCLSLARCIQVNRTALASLSVKKGDIKGDNGCGTAVVPTRISLLRDLPTPSSSSLSSYSLSSSSSPVDTTLFKPAAFYQDSENTPKAKNLMGIKVVSVRSQNPLRKEPLPTVPATITLLDSETGQVNALLGGTYLTAARTAAGSAIATKLCLEKMSGGGDVDSDSDGKIRRGKHLVVFGAGLQGEMHIRCIHQILRGGSYSLSKVTIVNRSRDRAQRLVDRIKSSSDSVNVDGVDDVDDDYDGKGGDNISELDYQILTLDGIDPHQSDIDINMDHPNVNALELKEAVQDADIIVTAIHTPQPVFNWNWVLGSNTNDNDSINTNTNRNRKRCHINGVGSYQPSTQEVDATFVRDHCWTFADSLDALNVGDLKYVKENEEKKMKKEKGSCGAGGGGGSETNTFMGILGDYIREDEYKNNNRNGNRDDDGREDKQKQVLPMNMNMNMGAENQWCTFTFFKSAGTAIQDIITADEVVKTAARLGIGTRIEI